MADLVGQRLALVEDALVLVRRRPASICQSMTIPSRYGLVAAEDARVVGVAEEDAARGRVDVERVVAALAERLLHRAIGLLVGEVEPVGAVGAGDRRRASKVKPVSAPPSPPPKLSLIDVDLGADCRVGEGAVGAVRDHMEVHRHRRREVGQCDALRRSPEGRHTPGPCSSREPRRRARTAAPRPAAGVIGPACPVGQPERRTAERGRRQGEREHHRRSQRQRSSNHSHRATPPIDVLPSRGRQVARQKSQASRIRWTWPGVNSNMHESSE